MRVMTPCEEWCYF